MPSLDSVPLYYPIQPPPLGITSNFVNPDSNGFILTTIGSIFLVFQIGLFSTRIYGKLFVAHKFGWDDATCTVGFILTLLQYILSVLSVQHGYTGYHDWDINIGQLASSKFFIIQLLMMFSVAIGLAFIKLTFFIWYLQLFKPLKWARYAIWFGIVTSSIAYIIIVVLTLVFAVPRPGETFIEHLNTKANEQETKIGLLPAAVSIVFDFYILFLPLGGIMGLQLSLKRKIGVSLIFLTGFLACVCSILTLYYRVKMQHQVDVYRTLTPLLTTTLVEMQIGLICSCMPTCAFLARYAKEKSQKDSQYTSYGRSSASRGLQKRRQNQYRSIDESIKSRDTGVESLELSAGKPSVRSAVQPQILNGRGEKFHTSDDAIDVRTQIRQEHRHEV